MRIVFKQRPLSFHNRATPAAIASMAANNQNKFWPYHDKLFEGKKFEDSDLERYAEELGLDMEKFKVDIKSKELAAIVKKHDQQCVKIGASGTPAFFVNGRSMSGAKPFAEFKTIIDEELKKAQKRVTDGVPRDQVYAAIMKDAGKKPSDGSSQLGPRTFRFNLKDSASLGPKTAAATLVIFSDFQ